MTAKKKQLETVLVSYEDFIMPEFNPPSKYFVRLAFGDYLFMKTNKRSVAQEFVNENYDGIYVIRTM